MRLSQKWLRTLLALLFGQVAMLSAPGTTQAGIATILPNKQASCFTANQGQWPDSILFRVSVPGAVVWITPTGRYYQFFEQIESKSANSGYDHLRYYRDRPEDRDQVKTWMVRVEFERAGRSSRFFGERMTDYKCNYFLGNDKSRWATNVPNYESVVVERLYPGIDIRYYIHDGKFEYDLIAAAGADLSQVRIRVAGMADVRVDEKGRLTVNSNGRTFVESVPKAYQIDGVNEKTVSIEFQSEADGSIGLSTGKKYQSNLKTIIDPILEFSTVIGTSEREWAGEIEVGSDGDFYLGGWTYSDDFPTVNAIDSILDGSTDTFLLKIDGNTLQPIFSTFLGGSMKDVGRSISLDGSDNVYVTGETFSDDFPLVNSWKNGKTGVSDVFIASLSSSGDNLLYATYFGGSEFDSGGDIDVDYDGSVAVVGFTASQDIPVVNSFQATYGGGYSDVLLFKLNLLTNQLAFSTYLGGQFSEDGLEIVLDNEENIVAIGRTSSNEFPTYNAIDAGNSADDAWVAKFDGSDYHPVFITLLGGRRLEVAVGLTVDQQNDIYVTGQTRSPDFPLKNPFQAYVADGSSAFLTKIDADGDSLIFSTYYTAEYWSVGIAVKVDNYGRIFLVGDAHGGLPLKWPFQNYSGNNARDGFVATFSSSGQELLFASYLGGTDQDAANGIALLNDGAFVLSGITSSNDFPTTDGSPSGLGAEDLFIAVISECCDVGDVNFDTSTNIEDLVYLVNFLILGGETPPCYRQADMDGDGQVTLSDLVYLIDFFFRGGAEPVNCGTY